MAIINGGEVVLDGPTIEAAALGQARGMDLAGERRCRQREGEGGRERPANGLGLGHLRFPKEGKTTAHGGGRCKASCPTKDHMWLAAVHSKCAI